MAWPHVLQEYLTSRFPQAKIEVVNAGVPGYTSDESLRNLRRRVLPLDPDLVIFYEANNEIVRDSGELASRLGMVSQKRHTVGVDWLSRHLLLFDLVAKNASIGCHAGRDLRGRSRRFQPTFRIVSSTTFAQ